MTLIQKGVGFMRKIIICKPDRYNIKNDELMKIRQHFLNRIQSLGGLDNCRENQELIQELEEYERQFDLAHENIIERFLYNGTVHWVVEKYDETTDNIKIFKYEDGSEKLLKLPEDVVFNF